jgi:hypothetical protein
MNSPVERKSAGGGPLPDFSDRDTPIALSWSLAAGFLGWGLDLAMSYVLEQHSCSTGRPYLLHMISAICFCIAVSGISPSLSALRNSPEEADQEGGRFQDRVYFQSLMGLGFSISFAVVILAAAVPRWILSPCD